MRLFKRLPSIQPMLARLPTVKKKGGYSGFTSNIQTYRGVRSAGIKTTVGWAPNNFYCCGALKPQSSSSSTVGQLLMSLPFWRFWVRGSGTY